MSSQEFGRLAHDGLLLEGKVEEYEKAFSGVDVDDQGVITKDGPPGLEMMETMEMAEQHHAYQCIIVSIHRNILKVQ